MKIQVLFGSANDERVYGPLCRSLEKCGEVQDGGCVRAPRS